MSPPRYRRPAAALSPASPPRWCWCCPPDEEEEDGSPPPPPAGRKRLMMPCRRQPLATHHPVDELGLGEECCTRRRGKGPPARRPGRDRKQRRGRSSSSAERWIGGRRGTRGTVAGTWVLADARVRSRVKLRQLDDMGDAVVWWWWCGLRLLQVGVVGWLKRAGGG